MDAYKKAGFEPRVVLTMHRADNMLDLCRKGMGIVLLNKAPILPMLTEDLVAVDIEPRIITHINLAYPKNKQLNIGARRLMEMVRVAGR
ncbi:MAG: LysR family transcriptional regulator substrate-binding protein [Clostridia bacterium]|nr:LysR family transcriptional regulator substrate-binding protein [Clostridia bacterium]